jgi:aldehyde dehydrogenase (NAD(P)+)
MQSHLWTTTIRPEFFVWMEPPAYHLEGQGVVIQNSSKMRIPGMDTEKLDRSVELLQEHKDEWARLPIPKKIELLLQVRSRLGERAEKWVETSAKSKSMDPHSPWVGEEWTTGPWAIAEGINGYLDTLQALAAGRLLKPKKVSTRPDGQVVARIFPANIFNVIMLNGIHADVWMQPGVSAADLESHMGAFYRQEDPSGKVSLVLGAGNVTSIAPLDAIYKLYACGQVVLLKLSPVNDCVGPILEDVFAPLIEAGFLQCAYGGADVGKYLVQHAGIDEIHITGSAHTHDSIVFGSEPEGAERKRLNQPLISKPITSELGGVGPVIIAPGKWSRADIRFQAENVVTMKLHNNGYNCVASQVLILPESWNQREEFLDAVRDLMRRLPPRPAFYPGATERHQEALAAHANVEQFSADETRLLITDVDPNAENVYCFNKEFFGAVFAQTSLPGKDAAEFLRNAVDFCNRKLSGTLGATLIVHPRTIKELGPALDNSIAALRYGSVGVNIWNAAAFLLAQASWGAYPGHSFADIQSGMGVVGNSFLFDKPEKTVARGCFYPFPRSWLHGESSFFPRPPWFVTNKTAHLTTKRVAMFAASPGYRHLPGILISALLG